MEKWYYKVMAREIVRYIERNYTLKELAMQDEISVNIETTFGGVAPDWRMFQPGLLQEQLDEDWALLRGYWIEEWAHVEGKTEMLIDLTVM